MKIKILGNIFHTTKFHFLYLLFNVHWILNKFNVAFFLNHFNEFNKTEHEFWRSLKTSSNTLHWRSFIKLLHYKFFIMKRNASHQKFFLKFVFISFSRILPLDVISMYQNHFKYCKISTNLLWVFLEQWKIWYDFAT